MGNEPVGDFSFSAFTKEDFDVPTLLNQMRYADICVAGIGGSVCLRVYFEKVSTLECVAENLNTLAIDKDANYGVGVSPETVCGAIEIIARLKELSYGRYAIVVFYENGHGETGLLNAITKINGDFYFRIAAEFAEAALIHERCSRKVSSYKHPGDKWPQRLWNVRDYIVYQTEDSRSSKEAEALVLLALPVPEGRE